MANYGWWATFTLNTPLGIMGIIQDSQREGSTVSTRMMLIDAGGMFSFMIAFPLLFSGIEEYIEQISLKVASSI